MSALTRFERGDDFFPEFFRRMWRPMQMPSGLPSEIPVDVTENDRGYVVKAEIPGVKKDDIRVTIDGSTLSIAAEVKHETEKKEGTRVLMRELTQGSVSRSMTFAWELDEREAMAKYDNGILELTLPKKREAKGRTLTIS